MVWKSFSLSKVCLALYFHWAIHCWSGKVSSSLQSSCTYVLATIQCHAWHRLLQFRSHQILSGEMLHHWNIVKLHGWGSSTKSYKSLYCVRNANNVVHNSPVDKEKLRFITYMKLYASGFQLSKSILDALAILTLFVLHFSCLYWTIVSMSYVISSYILYSMQWNENLPIVLPF